jgi:hypothetical protein
VPIEKIAVATAFMVVIGLLVAAIVVTVSKSEIESTMDLGDPLVMRSIATSAEDGQIIVTARRLRHIDYDQYPEH